MINHNLNPELIFQHLDEHVMEFSVPLQEKLIQCALKCMENRVKYGSEPLQSPDNVRKYLRLNLGDEKNEIFGILFLDIRHRVLTFEKLFYGTIDTATVYPRVVLQQTLFQNAASVIFVHNHPSGDVKPSREDRQITDMLKNVLEVIDVKVLDHIIVSANEAYSFAENGLI